MKKSFAAFCACALFTLSACAVKIYDPFSGNLILDGKVEDNPPPERARELFAQLEDGLKKNLEALREARRTQNEQAQTICLDNIDRGAEAKASLTSRLAG